MRGLIKVAGSGQKVVLSEWWKEQRKSLLHPATSISIASTQQSPKGPSSTANFQTQRQSCNDVPSLIYGEFAVVKKITLTKWWLRTIYAICGLTSDVLCMLVTALSNSTKQSHSRHFPNNYTGIILICPIICTFPTGQAWHGSHGWWLFDKSTSIPMFPMGKQGEGRFAQTKII